MPSCCSWHANATAGRARAATQNFGPKEAEVTIEDGWKTVHLTSSKFMWQFRDDQPPEEVWGYNEQIPGPTLRFRAGDKVRIYYTNHLDEASTVHWHGLVVPNSMDGVGLLTQPPIMPGETMVYEYTIPNTPGTFMYHAHMDDMEQVSMGLSGAFIVDPHDGGDGRYDQDHIVLLNNINGHYLINGKEFPNIDPWLVKTGDLLRVRMINISPIELTRCTCTATSRRRSPVTARTSAQAAMPGSRTRSSSRRVRRWMSRCG